MDVRLHAMILHHVWVLEWEPELHTAERWQALARVLGLGSFEQIPKPNFHHDSARGGETTVAFGLEALPGIVEGLLHAEGRDLARAHRLLKMFGADAELAAPFVIHLWNRPKSDKMAYWLGSPWNRYDAIAGCGVETIDLVRLAIGSRDPARRQRACLALPRFGGRGNRGIPELTEAREDAEWTVAQAAEIGLRAFQVEEGIRASIYNEAMVLDSELRDTATHSRRVARLCNFLSAEDVYVRAFAARSLTRPARDPQRNEERLLVREAFERALARESSPFVKPWLEYGLLDPWPDLSDRLCALLDDARLRSLQDPHTTFSSVSRSEKIAAFRNAHALGETPLEIVKRAGSILQEFGRDTLAAHSLGDNDATQLLRQIDTALVQYRERLGVGDHWRALGDLYGWDSHLYLPYARYGQPKLGDPRFLAELGDDALIPIADALVHGNVRERIRATMMLEAIGARAELAAPFVIWSWGREVPDDEIYAKADFEITGALRYCGTAVQVLIKETRSDENPIRARRARQALVLFD